MEKLKSAAAASKHDGRTRILNVSSIGHTFGPFRFSDYNFTTSQQVPEGERPNWERLAWRGSNVTLGYEPMVAYAQSKTAVGL
jgi:NAD(P)-dependent dehydrogenase (short-subunit alcohol dehydrogenase family)